MNIVLNNRLQKISFLFVIALLLSFSTPCFAQTESNTVKTQIAEANTSSDCSSPNTVPQTFPEWQGSELHKAVIELNISAVRKLLKPGSNVNEKDNHGNTPLITALSQRIYEPKPKPREVVLRNRQKEAKAQLEITQMLLKHGADVNQEGFDGKIAVIKAVTLHESVVLKILDLLIQNKADVNIRDNQGLTALMAAARTSRPKVVKFLLKNGADAKLKNCEKKTALSIAQEYKFAAVIQLLNRQE